MNILNGAWGHVYVAVCRGERLLRHIHWNILGTFFIDIHTITLSGFPVHKKVAIGMIYHRDGRGWTMLQTMQRRRLIVLLKRALFCTCYRLEDHMILLKDHVIAWLARLSTMHIIAARREFRERIILFYMQC